ncbi:MAG: dihydroorotase [Deltaproteobacteria bacterium]|nr:dihydroorotase [Deltaproteobacteria bacterium]
MAIWIKDGTLVDPEKGTVESMDLIIERGRIKRILPPGTFQEPGERLRVINAEGNIVVPGLIDMHVHLREPGHEYKENVATGARSGVAGGYTAVACMPNTQPVNDVSSVTRFIIRQASQANLLKVYPIGAITKGLKGETLTDFGDLRSAGAVGVSDDGCAVANSEVMRRAMEYARYHGLTIISHCEDVHLSAGGAMHEGAVSTQIGLPGIPGESEEIMVQREICLAKLTRCPVHIAHVSTSGAVEMIRRAKEDGIPVTAETAPHYFSLDHTAVIGYNTSAKMNPPLRRIEDVEAVKKGLSDGVIDVIATDHAPHSALEKEVEFDQAAFGIIGLETALPLVLVLVRDNVLTLAEAIKKLTHHPATILGIEGGSIKEGQTADCSVIDTGHEYIYKMEDIQSRSKNSPFIGKKMKGICVLTMVGGRIVWERNKGHFSR